MKHFDKENLIVIGIALAILIAWGIWYPQRQAKVNAISKERQAAAQALAAKNAAAQKYADQQAEKKAAEKPAVSRPAPAPKAPVPPPAPVRKQLPPEILSNDLALFTIDTNSATIDRIADEFLKVADIEDSSGTDPVAADAPVTSAPDPSGSLSPELSALLDLLRPMTEQQLKAISDLIKGGSRIDQIARLIDLELVGIPHDSDEYDKITAIQTILIELRAGRKKKDQSQIDKFNARYGKK